MTPRLDQASSRQLWAAFWMAALLFIVAIVLVLARMGSADPVVPPKDALSGSAVSGSR